MKEKTNDLRQWLKLLDELAEPLGNFDNQYKQIINNIRQCFKKNTVNIVFGGHFKSGKSTLLNSALKRNILPMDDLPETGATCQIRSGKKDLAIVHRTNGQTQTIACTTDAIRSEVALISATGQRRSQVNEIERVSLTLKQTFIPTFAIWMDSPGIKDTSEMDICAQRAADNADVLVWVLSSKHCFAESEQEFLEQYIEKKGLLSIVFVLNIFLPDDTPKEWNLFVREKSARMMSRIKERALQLGFNQSVKLLLIPVAARAASMANDRSLYGATKMEKMLSEIESNIHPRVLGTRLHEAAFSLSQIASELKEKCKEETELIDLETQLMFSCQEDALQHQKNFRKSLEQELEYFFIRIPKLAKACSNELSDSITIENFKCETPYSQQLKALLKNTIECEAEKFLEVIDQLIKDKQQKQLNQSGINVIRSLLNMSELTFITTQTPVSDNAGLGGLIVAGGIAGIVSGGIGLFPAIVVGIIGGAATLGCYENKAKQEDVFNTKEKINRVVANAIIELKHKQNKILIMVMELTDNTEEWSKPDRGRQKLLLELEDKSNILAKQALEMAQIKI